MTNRQARREQAKTTRTPRAGGGGPPARRPNRPSSAPQRPSSGPSDFMSRPFLVIVGALIVVAIGVVAFLALRSSGSDDELVTSLETAESNLPLEMADGTKLGSDSAPLKLVAYEDFQCPFCLRYTGEDEPGIVEEYVKTGKVQIEYRHMPILGTESFRAAMGSECAAEQNKFWQFHGKLFQVQAEAGQATSEKIDDGRFSDAKLQEYASELGLDSAQFNACLTSDKHLDKITDDEAQARQYGISGTPNFLVNNQAAGGDKGSLENWRTFLDTNIDLINGAGATQTASAGVSPSASASASASPATTPTAGTSPTAATAAATATP